MSLPTARPGRRRPSRAALGLGALALLAATTPAITGCNFVRFKRDGFERRFRDAGLRQRSVTLGEDTLSFWEGGAGPPVMLIPGFGPQAIWHWNEQVQALARTHRVVVADLLWAGQSTSTRAEYGLGHESRALLALLDHLGIERTDLVGLSYGGFVAWVMAAFHPERVGKVAMIGSPGAAYSSADYQALLARHQVRDGSELFMPHDAEGVRRVLAFAYQDPPWLPPFAREQAVREVYAGNREQMRSMMDAAVAQLDHADAVPTPDKPFLLIWGENDPIFPLHLSRKTLERLGGRAALHVIPHAHHAPNLEHPEQVNALLEAFLSSPAPAPASPPAPSSTSAPQPPR